MNPSEAAFTVVVNFKPDSALSPQTFKLSETESYSRAIGEAADIVRSLSAPVMGYIVRYEEVIRSVSFCQTT